MWRQIEQGKHRSIVFEAVVCDIHCVAVNTYQAVVRTKADDVSEMVASIFPQYFRHLCQ